MICRSLNSILRVATRLLTTLVLRRTATSQKPHRTLPGTPACLSQSDSPLATSAFRLRFLVVWSLARASALSVPEGTARSCYVLRGR